MSVWVALHHIPYEGDELLGIGAEQDDAKEFCQEHSDTFVAGPLDWTENHQDCSSASHGSYIVAKREVRSASGPGGSLPAQARSDGDAEAAWQAWYEPETDISRAMRTSPYDAMHRAFLAGHEAAVRLPHDGDQDRWQALKDWLGATIDADHQLAESFTDYTDGGNCSRVHHAMCAANRNTLAKMRELETS